jgi:hypothetical protein
MPPAERPSGRSLVIARVLAVPAAVGAVALLLAPFGLFAYFWFTFSFLVASSLMLSRWVSTTRSAFVSYAPREADSPVARMVERRVLTVFCAIFFIQLLFCGAILLWSLRSSGIDRDIWFAIFFIPFVLLRYLRFGMVYLCFYMLRRDNCER